LQICCAAQIEPFQIIPGCDGDGDRNVDEALGPPLRSDNYFGLLVSFSLLRGDGNLSLTRRLSG
jgi:hypothetical protein